MPLTSAEAVLRYAGDFIPSWAGAISIDLLPAVLVGMMAVVHAAMRRGEDEMEEADRITAGDMLRSLDLQRVAARQAPGREPGWLPSRSLPPRSRRRAAGRASPQEARPAAENVTPLTLGDRKRSDP